MSAHSDAHRRQTDPAASDVPVQVPTGPDPAKSEPATSDPAKSEPAGVEPTAPEHAGTEPIGVGTPAFEPTGTDPAASEHPESGLEPSDKASEPAEPESFGRRLRRLALTAPEQAAPDLTAPERRAIRIEIAVVLVVTFGLQGVSAALSLIDSAISPEGMRGRTVALNASRTEHSLIDLLFQLVGVAKLAGWAALGLYLLWRSGIGPRLIGFGWPRVRADLPPGLALAAIIGLPGLALYLIAHALGFSVTIVPSAIDDHWWRLPVLILSACANSVAEEVLVVGYLLTRLRALGWSANSSLLASALLRGSYHLYQGVGGGLGNVVMGLIFGRYWQRTNKLWPLVIAHAVIDAVAYLGYVALRGRVGWLP